MPRLKAIANNSKPLRVGERDGSDGWSGIYYSTKNSEELLADAWNLHDAYLFAAAPALKDFALRMQEFFKQNPLGYQDLREACEIALDSTKRPRIKKVRREARSIRLKKK